MTQVLIILMETNASGIFYIILHYSLQMNKPLLLTKQYICTIIYIMLNRKRHVIILFSFVLEVLLRANRKIQRSIELFLKSYLFLR